MKPKFYFNLNCQKHLVDLAEAQRLAFIDDSTNIFTTQVNLPRIGLSANIVFMVFLPIKIAKDINAPLFILQGQNIPSGLIQLIESLGFINHLQHNPDITITVDHPDDPYSTEQFIAQFNRFDKLIDTFKGAAKFQYSDQSRVTFETEVLRLFTDLKSSKDAFLHNYTHNDSRSGAPEACGLILT